MGLDVRGINHLRVCRSSVPGKLPEQVLPDAAPRPAHKAIINRCRWAIFRRAIAPAATALQHMHDTANHAVIIHPLNASYIRRQQRLDPLPLLVIQPK